MLRVLASEDEQAVAFPAERGGAQLGIGRGGGGEDGVVEQHGFALATEFALHDGLLLAGVELERAVAFHHLVEKGERPVHSPGVDAAHGGLPGEEERGLGVRPGGLLLGEQRELRLGPRVIAGAHVELAEFHADFGEQSGARVVAEKRRGALDGDLAGGLRGRFVAEKNGEVGGALGGVARGRGFIRHAEIAGRAGAVVGGKSQFRERQPRLALAPVLRVVVEESGERLRGAGVGRAGAGETLLEEQRAAERAVGRGTVEHLVVGGKALVIPEGERGKCGAVGRVGPQARGAFGGAAKGIRREQPLALPVVDERPAQLDLGALPVVGRAPLGVFERHHGGGQVAFGKEQIGLQQTRSGHQRAGREILQEAIQRLERAVGIFCAHPQPRGVETRALRHAWDAIFGPLFQRGLGGMRLLRVDLVEPLKRGVEIPARGMAPDEFLDGGVGGVGAVEPQRGLGRTERRAEEQALGEPLRRALEFVEKGERFREAALQQE